MDKVRSTEGLDAAQTGLHTPRADDGCGAHGGREAGNPPADGPTLTAMLLMVQGRWDCVEWYARWRDRQPGEKDNDGVGN